MAKLNNSKVRVYIAAPWIHKPDAIAAAKKFTDVGFNVTSRWFTHIGDPHDSAGKGQPDNVMRRQAAEDIADVRLAHCFVVLNLAKSEGKAFEAGIAYANEIPIISVGPRGHIFQTLGYEVATVEEAILMVEGMTWRL